MGKEYSIQKVAVVVCMTAVLAVTCLAVSANAFTFGVETHLYRQLWWSDKHRVPGLSKDAGYEAMLDRIAELDVDFVRDSARMIDLMQTEGSPLNFDVLGPILGDLRQRGVKMDMVIIEAPNWAKDLSAGDESDYLCPPVLSKWQAFLTALATQTQSFNPIYEIWNEMDYEEFWGGSESSAVNLISGSAAAIKAVNPSVQVIPGGLAATFPASSNYWKQFKALLDSGKVDKLAFHYHGTLDDLHSLYNSTIAPLEIDSGKLLLNESGYHTYPTERAQAREVCGKAIYSIAKGFDAYSAYYLGLISNANADLDNIAQTGHYFSLVNPNTRQPRLAFNAYKHTINQLKDSALRATVKESSGTYQYVFTRGSQNIFVSIGNTPDAAQIEQYLGNDYRELDMLGQENGQYSDIVYYVSGQYEPDTDHVSDGSDSGGGCNMGLISAFVPALIFTTFFRSAKS